MSDELIEKLESLELPQHENVQSLFDGTCAARALVEHTVVPMIIGMLNRNAYEEAVAGVYYRISAWLKSLEKLNHPVDVQAVFSGGRSIFELLLDIKLLIANPNDAERFHDFTISCSWSDFELQRIQ